MPDVTDRAIKSGEIIDRLYSALEHKDLEGARNCCTPDAVFWHSFDGVAQDLEQAAQGWQGLFAMFAENRVVDIRREAIDGGIVQRHLFLLRGVNGELKGKPCCIFVRLRDGLIARLDEYIDLSGDVTVADDMGVTAGLPEGGQII